METQTEETPMRRFDTEIIRQPLRYFEIAGCVALLIVFALYLKAGFALPRPFNAMDIGAGGFPKLVGVAALLAVAAVLGTAIAKSLAHLPHQMVAIQRPLYVAAAVVMLIVQALAFERIGALACVGLFALLTMLACGERRLVHLIGSPLVLVGFVYLVFDLAFGVSLP